MTDKSEKLKILFLCTGNSCRSQMAEGWARELKKKQIEPYSAGVVKHGINPFAVKAMAEVGIDISGQKSRLIEELPVREFDWVITLCGHANETCPFFPGKKVHKGFDDPPKRVEESWSEEEKLVVYRRVRDEIKEFILSLPEGLLANL